MVHERSAALEAVVRSRASIRRLFYVGWENAHGYYLVAPTAPNVRVMPDILDARVMAAFDRENRQQTLSAHIGQKLLCECDGVSWFYHEPRFLVRAARLIWSN